MGEGNPSEFPIATHPCSASSVSVSVRMYVVITQSLKGVSGVPFSSTVSGNPQEMTPCVCVYGTGDVIILEEAAYCDPVRPSDRRSPFSR